MKEHKQEIKIVIHKKKPMNPDSFKHWGVKQRRWVHPFVYPPVLATTININILSKDKNIGDYFCEHFEPGTFILFGWSHGKTKTRLKKVMLCKVIIQDNENNKFQITDTNRLNRYWFRRKKEKNKNEEEET